MRNKFTITEGESQRILSLHKKAILKENGQNILNEENCKNKTPFNALTDGGLNFKKERQKWVAANCNGTTPCILGNSKTNINLRNAFCDKTWPTNQNNSNKYTFDFDAIMKAINDTGKCAGYSGSSDGTNGTSGTQGTSGTNGIQNPVPINNKISAELYYQITAP
jgi:hypothetical protein